MLLYVFWILFPLTLEGATFQYPLYLREPPVFLSPAFVGAKDAATQIIERYSDVEARWQTKLPVDATSSPTVSEEDSKEQRFTFLQLDRGALAERADFSSSFQPGAPPFAGPSGLPVQNGKRVNSSVDPNRGGNFCDEGAPSSRCVIDQPLRFPGNYTISGSESVPFTKISECNCSGFTCVCSVRFDEFLPSWASLSWARISSYAEMGSSPRSWASFQADGVLIQGECAVPTSCNLYSQGAPHDSEPCHALSGEYFACSRDVDVSSMAADGIVDIVVTSGSNEYALSTGRWAGSHILHNKFVLEGEYLTHGVLDIRQGGAIICTFPNCTLTIEGFRWMHVYEGGVISAQNVIIRVPAITVAGRIAALNLQVAAGALAVNHTGELMTADREYHSRADIDARPANFPHDLRYLPDSCRAGCDPCTCLTVDGLVWFTRVVVTGLSLRVGPHGHVSADGLGHRAAEGPGGGGSSPLGGGGGGGGGNGAAACQAGAGGGGAGGYGSAIGPSDTGFCAGDSQQASILLGDCQRAAAADLGSGGGHGLVQGGQGGGAVRIFTDVEVFVEGTVSARGEDSACVSLPVEVIVSLPPQPDDSHQTNNLLWPAGRYIKTISQPGGGGGGGGTVWITSPRVAGAGLVSAAGGSANRSCDVVRVVASGGAGGGGRIALDYVAADTVSLRIEAPGGSSRCTRGGAGTIFHSLERVLIADNRLELIMPGRPGDFGRLVQPPAVLAAYTPWAAAGAAAQAARLAACAYQANYTLPFGCEQTLLTMVAVGRVVVRGGALLEFPWDEVGSIVAEEVGFLMPTAASAAATALGDVTVQTGGAIGCVTCAGSREAANDVAGCVDTCPPWTLTLAGPRGDLVVKSGGKLLGVQVTVNVSAGSAELDASAWAAASDWRAASSLSVSAAANVTLGGSVWFGAVAFTAGATLLVQETSWVGADGLGYQSDTGPGAGGSTTTGGGGGGGHGGVGAQGCFDFATGGRGYDDAGNPLSFGSGGGAGGAGPLPNSSLVTPWANQSNQSSRLQRPVPSAALPAGILVRQLRRTADMVSATADLCRLRGSRPLRLDLRGDVDPSVPLSDFGTACPSGYQGSSLPDWCCAGLACDCTWAYANYHPGGRGGGAVSLSAGADLVIDGLVSADGEGSGCQGSVGSPTLSVPSAPGTIQPKTVAFASGGGGAGGSVQILADTLRGRGIVRANGGRTSAACARTRSGGGGGGGRIALFYAVDESSSLRAQAAGGTSDGCPSGGAGTKFYQLNRTLIADNNSSKRISAITPFLFIASCSDCTVISSNGANFEFSLGPVSRAYAVDGGAFVPTANSSTLVSAMTIVSNGGRLGCLDCTIAVDSQNYLPGCRNGTSNVCPPFKVFSSSMTFSRGGYLKGCEVEVDSDRLINIDSSSKWETADSPAVSSLHMRTNILRVDGEISFSSTQVVGMHMYVSSSGWISSNGLGPLGGHGSAAGMSAKMGGGGGGNGGNGAQGCYFQSSGGKSVWSSSDIVTSPWTFGSGGGQGGGNSASAGGRGGGRIRISLSGNFTLLGALSADGESTECIGVVRSWYIRNVADKPFIAGAHGGGAGGGGSVWVLASTIFGNGAIFARGGSSHCRSFLAWPGGGGGGGRVAVHSAKTAELMSLELNASGGNSGWDSDQADRSATGRITGCAAGGAGTIFIRSGNFSTLVVDNGSPARLSAMTPFPIYAALDRVVVRRGAVLQFPAPYNISNCSGPMATSRFSLAQSTSAPRISTTASVLNYVTNMTSSSFFTSSSSIFSTSTSTSFVTSSSSAMSTSSSAAFTSTSMSQSTGIIQNQTGTTALNGSLNFSAFSSTSATFTVQTSTPMISSTPMFSTIASTAPWTTLPTSTARQTTSARAIASIITASASSAWSCNSSLVVPAVIGDVIVEEQSAFVAIPGAQYLPMRTLTVDRGGIVGCLSCSDSVSAQNDVPGCVQNCLSYMINGTSMQAVRQGRIMGMYVNVSLSGSFNSTVNSGFVASDFGAESLLGLAASDLDVDGFIRFSTINITIGNNANVRQHGRIDSSALGYSTDQGPAAGTASDLGGGGGGSAGAGDNGCQKTPTGAISGKGGNHYVQNASCPQFPWILGSGGGHGNTKTWNSTVLWNDYQQLLSYPSGGIIACPFDRGCDDPEDYLHMDLGRKPAYLPTFEVRRAFGGVYQVENANALCWPRGAAVDEWISLTVIKGAAVPSNPKACAPGWSGSNMQDFCCYGASAGPNPDHLDWSGGQRACDCSSYTTGQNPGGSGGGRIAIKANNVFTLDGSIAAEGEATSCSGTSSHPGGGGAGGSIQLAVPIILGAGRISTVGGQSSTGCEDTFAGGGGGGGYVNLTYGIMTPGVNVIVNGGRTSCNDSRVGRFCDAVNVGNCNYTQLDDQFDSTYLNPFWQWSNEPPRFCTLGLESDAQLVGNYSARQGRCWDVSVSRLGWLTMVPSNLIDQWTSDTAHRLFISLPSNTPFDVSTHLQLINNDSSCVTAGIFARGALNNMVAQCSQCNSSSSEANYVKACQEFDWVTVGVLDSGEGSRLQWNTKGTTMQQVYGTRDRARLSDVFLRLVRDGDGVFRAYWKKTETADWSEFTLAQPLLTDTLEVGLFAAQCEEYGNASAAFEYFQDNSGIALDLTFGWRGQSGVVAENGIPADNVINTTSQVGSTGSFQSALQNSSTSNTSIVVLEVQGPAYNVQQLTTTKRFVMLRGSSFLDFINVWNATSSSRFVTSQRFVDDYGDFRDTSTWNGSGWVPLDTEFVVSVRPNPQGTQYVFYIDGAETPELTLSRPGLYERPNLYVFTLDAATFNTSNPLPTLNSSTKPSPLDGSGTASPHPFVITTRPDTGFQALYRVGTRNNGAKTGQVLIRLAASAPDILYYESANTPDMGGIIHVVDPLIAHANLFPFRRLMAADSTEGTEQSPEGGQDYEARTERTRLITAKPLRRRLEEFYSVYNTQKLDHLDDMVGEWAGKEDQLNELLRKRYHADLQSFFHLRSADADAFAAVQEDIPKLGIATDLVDNETTIIPPSLVTLDCGGANFFAPLGGVTPTLLLVDISVNIKRCNFSSSAGISSVIVHHSLARFTDCIFSGSEGGIQADSAFIEMHRATFENLQHTEAGSAVRVGTERALLAGRPRIGSSLVAIHRLSPQVYVSQSTFVNCSADSGGAVWVGRGTWYCTDCTFQKNRARSFGGAMLFEDFGSSFVSYSRISRNSAREGGAIHSRGGTVQFSFCNFTQNAAALHGGAGFLHPNSMPNPLVLDIGSESHTVFSPLSAVFLYCAFTANQVIGSATDPGAGGAFYVDGAASAQFERCEFVSNAAVSSDSEGGCFAVRDSGVLYLRDSGVANSSAAYGAALRIYTQTSGLVSVVFDNVTIRYNNATRFGGVLAGYSHRQARLTPFLHAAGKFIFEADPQDFRARTSLRFGFNADPYIDPYSATIAPAGTRIVVSNPYEPRHFSLTLPYDGRITDQWPFYATGERYSGYYNPQTTPGQKAASGGMSFLLNTDGSLWGAEQDRFGLTGGMCAFKDCNVYGNGPPGQGVCYFHAELDLQQCLEETVLL